MATRLKNKWTARQKPDFKAKTDAYNFRPHVVANRRESMKRRSANPVIQASEKARNAALYKANTAQIRARNKAWNANNKEWSREYIRKWAKQARRTIPYYNIRNRLCSRLWHAVTGQGGRKAYKTEDLIGCTVEALRQQLQRQFTEGMTWEKFLKGEIHIDHKIPLSTFDLTDPDQQKLAFHFSNLQALWAEDNLKKSDNLTYAKPLLQ